LVHQDGEIAGGGIAADQVAVGVIGVAIAIRPGDRVGAGIDRARAGSGVKYYRLAQGLDYMEIFTWVSSRSTICRKVLITIIVMMWVSYPLLS